MQTPQIIEVPSKKLIGLKIRTSLSENRTSELWRAFRPRIKEISQNPDIQLFSVQSYDKGFKMEHFSPMTFFDKWAAVEAQDFEKIPAEMESYSLTGGLYAVFIYKGSWANHQPFFNYIFMQWLPNSDYELDDREHFESFGLAHNPFDENSEEKVYIPIKKKKSL